MENKDTMPTNQIVKLVHKGHQMDFTFMGRWLLHSPNTIQLQMTQLGHSFLDFRESLSVMLKVIIKTELNLSLVILSFIIMALILKYL